MEKHPQACVGLSALLTTTMDNMKKVVYEIKQIHPVSKVLLGGAPVTRDFCNNIGADFYSPDPQGAVDFLNRIISQ